MLYMDNLFLFCYGFAIAHAVYLFIYTDDMIKIMEYATVMVIVLWVLFIFSIVVKLLGSDTE